MGDLDDLISTGVMLGQKLGYLISICSSAMPPKSSQGIRGGAVCSQVGRGAHPGRNEIWRI